MGIDPDLITLQTSDLTQTFQNIFTNWGTDRLEVSTTRLHNIPHFRVEYEDKRVFIPTEGKTLSFVNDLKEKFLNSLKSPLSSVVESINPTNNSMTNPLSTIGVLIIGGLALWLFLK